MIYGMQLLVKAGLLIGWIMKILLVVRDLNLDYIYGRQGPSALLPRDDEYPSSEVHHVTTT